MALTQEQRNRVGEVIKEILLRRIENFPEIGAEIRNAPFHTAFLESFHDRLGALHIEIPYLIAIASWLHGLNTSLGTGFETIAHILSGGYKRKFTAVFTPPVKEGQANHIDAIIRDLKAGTYFPNLARENALVLQFDPNDQDIKSLPFTADVFIETAHSITAIELKSVRPNSGEGRGEKQKILYGKAALKLKYPTKDIRFFIGFPFDPTSQTLTGYDKQNFFNYLIEFKKFFAYDEVLIASEFWNFLSGATGSMEEILDIIAEVVAQVKSPMKPNEI